MTLPIWIHLLLRQRARVTNIGSIRFVKNVVKRTKSRQRIQRWLLLAMRALAMVLIGLLFARPFFSQTPIDGRTREVAVLIDRSASMSALHENGTTAVEEAIRRARRYVASLGDQARVHIGLFDATGVESVPFADVANTSAAPTATNFEEALQWASDIMSSSNRRDRSVLLLSDLQRAGMPSTGGSLFPEEMELRIDDPAPAISQNLAVTDVTPTQVELRPGMPVTLMIRVFNAGAFPVIDAPVSIDLIGPAERFNESLEISLDAGQHQDIEFELPAKEAGIIRGTVTIDRQDPLPIDNQRFVAFEVRHPDRLLLVEGDAGRQAWENETYFVETALRLQTPIGDAPARTFEVEKLIWDQGDGFPDLTGFRLIVLANLSRFRQEDAQRLSQFVEEGGNVIWFAGERTTNAVWNPLVDSNLLGDAQIGPIVDSFARVSGFAHDHLALSPFENPQHGDLRSLMVRRLVTLESVDPRSTVLIRSRAWPLVVAHPTGKGQFVFVASSADRSWSDWPQNRLFVPLIRQLAAWLTGQLDANQPVISEIITDARLTPGIEQRETSLVVRNLDPNESDISRLGIDQFREAIGLEAEETSLSDEEEQKKFTPAGAARPDEAWPVIVWVLLGLLGLEMLLASRTHE